MRLIPPLRRQSSLLKPIDLKVSGSEAKTSAYNVGDPGSIPGSGRSPGEGNLATHSSTLAWKIPWTENSPWGRKESNATERLHFHFSLI